MLRQHAPQNSIRRSWDTYVSHIDDPLIANGRRCEDYSTTNLEFGISHALEHDIRIPGWWIPENEWVVIWQLHHDKSAICNSPPVEYKIQNERFQIIVRNDMDQYNVVYDAPLLLETDLRFRTEFRINPVVDGKTGGYLRVYLNDESVVTYSGPIGYTDSHLVYVKYGLYISPHSRIPTRAIKHRYNRFDS